MKKILSILIMMTMVISLAGCCSNTGSKPAGNTGSNTVQGVLDQQTKGTEENGTENQKTDPSDNAKPKPSVSADGSKYDVDLTGLSSTIIYSEVYNMMSAPEDYIGKTVCMNGQFALYQATDADGKPIPDQIYFACIITDATACCSQGLEFVLAGEHVYPDDYPELGSDITVSGTFETYDEDGYMYCHLVDAAFE